MGPKERSEDDRTWVLKTDSILYNSMIRAIKPLQFYGMYPINNLPMWVYYIHSAFLHCTLTLPVPVLTFAYLFINLKTMDLTAVIDLLFMVSELAITVLKYMPIRLYPRRVRRTLEWLNIEEFTTYHQDQANIAKSSSEVFKKAYYYFCISCTVTLGAVISKPIFMGEKIMPTTLWLPFNLENNYAFVFLYALFSLGISNSAYGNCSMDCMVAGLIFYAAGQLRIIKGALKDVVKHAEEKIANEHGNVPPAEFDELRNQYIYEDICRCVKRYNLVKEFTRDIEDTYSFSIFCQFAASIVVIGFACIQFFLVELWSVRFYVVVIWITCMTWEVFLYCYFGSLLYFESLTFVTDVYLTDWLNLDQKCQKAYIIIIENAKRPLMIRAGKIIDLSLDTFATIMRRSYSLLALLNKSMKK